MSQTLVDDLLVADDPGFACSKAKLVASGMPHLRPFNIGEDGALVLDEVYQVPVNECPASKINLEPGDILFNNTNSAELVGKSSIIPVAMRAGFSNHLTRLRVRRELADPAYFAYWLQYTRSKGTFTAQATQWVSQAAYKSSELRRLSLDLPSLTEQRRIVDLLSRAEGIVRLRREAQKKVAEIVPALFLDMFGDPATNPKGWPTLPLATLLASIDSGKSPKCHDRPRGDREWGVLRLSALTNGRYDESEHKTLPEGEVAAIGSEVRRGDVLLSRKNTHELVGTAAYVWKTGGRVLLPDLIFRLTLPPDSRLDPVYLWQLLSQPARRSTLRALASGSAGSMPNISKERLRALHIEVPPLGRQQAFARHVANVESVASQQHRADLAARQAFDALLARAFG